MKSDFIIALTQLAAERNLPREVVLSAIEAALVSAYKKDHVADAQDVSVKLDPASGEVSVYEVRMVAEEVAEPDQEITLDEARKINPEAEIGGVVPIRPLPHTAGRIAAQTAKQVVIQRLREAERELVFQEFADKEGEVFTVTIQRMGPKHIIVELGRAEAILPASEQAPYERYRIGQNVKVLLQSVRQSNKGPELIVSRADKILVKRLFESEVPEIFNGAVEIVTIAREPGSRSKVAVWAKQDGVDAVGSCVGLRGIRIQNIVNELHGEKIDVVQWNKDPGAFIAGALSPSMVMRVEMDADTASAVAVVPERQLSLAIGKEGQNARLAARLTGWKIDIKSNVEMEELAKAEAEAQAVAKDGEPAVQDTEEAPVEAPAAEVAEPVTIAAETAQEEQPEEVEVVEVAEPAAEAVPAEPESGEAEALPEEQAPAEPEAAPVEPIPPEVFIPELEPLAEPVPVGQASAPIQGLPDDIWSVRSRGAPETGVIRFAEDIEELSGVGARRGRRGPRRGAGQSGRGRRTKAGRRR